MSYALSAVLDLGMNAQEAADSDTSPSSSEGQAAARIFDALNTTLRYTDETYPPISGRVVDLYTVIASSPLDLDLTAIPTAADISEVVDLTGLKLVAGVLWAPKDNVGSIRISCPANGYELFGAAGDAITLLPGQRFSYGLDGESDTDFTNPNVAVAAAHKLIHLVGTPTTDVLKGLLLFGT